MFDGWQKLEAMSLKRLTVDKVRIDELKSFDCWQQLKAMSLKRLTVDNS